MTDIQHDSERTRFHDGDAYLAYQRPSAQVIDFLSVQVPPERRGAGVAGALARAAFAYAADHNLKVRPTCSYIAGAFLTRNPEFQAQVED